MFSKSMTKKFSEAAMTGRKFTPAGDLSRLVRYHLRRQHPQHNFNAFDPATQQPVRLEIQNPFLTGTIGLRLQAELAKRYPPDWQPIGRKNLDGAQEVTYEQEGVIVRWLGGENLKETLATKRKGKSPTEKMPGDFKGTLRERRKPAKIAAVQQRLAEMPKRVAEWRAVSLGCGAVFLKLGEMCCLM